MFNAIADIVIGYDADLKIFVMAGDVADRKNISEEERNLFLSFITRLALAGIKIVVINGNHDFYTESLTLLEPLKFLAALNSNIHVVLGDPARITINGIGFGCVPCQQDLKTSELEAIAKRLHSQAPCKRFYMVVHEAVFGAVNHKRTWKAKSDKYLRIPDLDFVTGWMLGDIHERQQITSNAWYSGSPIQVKSDENPSNGILQWSGSKTRFIPVKTRGFRFTTSPQEALKLAREGHYVRFSGKVPPDIEFPHNVAVDGDVAAIEIDIDAGTYDDDAGASEFKVEIDLVGPLPNFLASKGVQEHHQRMSVELVSSILQTRTAIAEEDDVSEEDDE
jgi:DNA repair exonuclease SbcCD nuclease subunit